MLKQQLLEDLKRVAEELGYPSTDIVCSIPKNSEFGDYTTNLALQLAKLKSISGKQSSIDIANEITEKIKVAPYLEKVEVAGGGFINFFIKTEVLVKNMDKVSKLENSKVFVSSKESKTKKVMVEFAHPNTHKAFHIGHLRNISTGESIVRLLEAVGFEVIRANYEGDVGMHIAKAIYALLHVASFNKEISKIKGVKERVEFLGKAYAAGSKAFEEDKQAQKVIKDINFLVYAAAQRYQQEKGIEPSSTDYLKFVEDRKDEVDQVFELWKETRQWSLDYFETIYKRVYSHFDRYYFESECLSGVDRAKEAVKRGILEENEGAVIFNGGKYGLDTRVFINSLGLPTYEAKELTLAAKEISEFGQLAKIIHVVGPEQSSFFKVTFKVEELLDSNSYQDKQYHLVYGWVRLKQGKMSSRTGEVVLGEWLLDEAKNQIKKEFPQMDEKTLEIVGVGAVKYSMLKFSTSSEISFSFEDSISLEGDSGPYIQYSYARAKSVLRSAGFVYQGLTEIKDLENEERSILQKIEYWEEVVSEAANNFSPNIIAQYLTDLAKTFNLFYQKHRIIKSEGKKKDLRLALTFAVAILLKQGLYLLGIESPERM
ncbi:arginine--tRNA ligase [Candidatus Daviesbacteria bacterium]|nr:arginine--tRNA ligase [Candidatus Daviesbacteria bacterium]